jgi:hypothetical protein
MCASGGACALLLALFRVRAAICGPLVVRKVLVHVGGNPLPVMTKDERRRTKSLLVVGLSSLVILTSNQLQPSCTSSSSRSERGTDPMTNQPLPQPPYRNSKRWGRSKLCLPPLPPRSGGRYLLRLCHLGGRKGIVLPDPLGHKGATLPDGLGALHRSCG